MLRLEAVTKEYKPGVPILNAISFSVKPGEVVAIMGPNGCGKSTLLSLLAGFTKPTEGTIAAGTNQKIGFVFQSVRESLFPWMTVERQTALAAEARCVPAERIRAILSLLGLTEHKNKYPYELSGGLAQLAAIGRAAVGEPQLFLLDEPFAALDYYTSLAVVERLAKLLEERHMTTILVTHTLEQAILLADRIIILSPAPGTIIADIAVPLPRPRRANLVGTPAFDAVQREAFKHLQGFLCASV